jgi:iron complex outermembrane receptor protein
MLHAWRDRSGAGIFQAEPTTNRIGERIMTVEGRKMGARDQRISRGEPSPAIVKGRWQAWLLGGAALGAVLPFASGSAMAQDNPAAPVAEQADVAAPAETVAASDIVVTGSRVARQGFTAPTPTTVIDAKQIEAAATASIADYVNQQPALVGSQTPRSGMPAAGPNIGAQHLNLRSLGPNRTLVLLDGRRVAPSTLTGNVDAALLPQGLVQRVDIVTGGASAAWGSDAVAGVVNFVLDKTFTGVRLDVEGGAADEGDFRSFKANLSLGAEFADGRGHILLSGELRDDGAGDFVTSRDWYRGYKVINNPAFTPTNGAPRRIVAPDVGYAFATGGGLINGPATINFNGQTIRNPLLNTQFGPGGVPIAFNPGFSAGSVSMGGDAKDISEIIRLGSPVKGKNAFARISYEILPDVTAFGEFSYANIKSRVFARIFQRDNITIRADNAFLDQSIRDQMTAVGMTSFTLGRVVYDWGALEGRNEREQIRFVGGLEGKFGEGWSWNAYYQHGKTDFTNGDWTQDPITAQFNQAVDAVRAPNGSIVCRSSLASPGNGCVPLNLFGAGSASQAAIDYVTNPHSIAYTTIKQDVAAFSINGEPFSLWAGPVSVAAGLEYRKESFDVASTPLDEAGAFFLGNYKASRGSFDVKEGFLEVVAPLLADTPFVKQLDFNGAIRYTDYSLSGGVTSWKLGLTWDVDDQLRFRGTRSKDIRAANLNELFQAGTVANTAINDPVSGTSYSILQTQTGNRALDPEKADTTAIGFVYRPDWLRGFGLSVDYFDIKIKGAIFTQAAQTVVDQCRAGTAIQCGYISRDPVSGLIRNVTLLPQNVNSERTKGIDIELNYRTSLEDWFASLGGDLSLRAVGTYVDSRSVTANGITTEYAGQNANLGQASEAVPSWRWLASMTYDKGPFSTTLTGRFIGAGKINNAWGPADIDDNHVPAVFYADLSASYEFRSIGKGTKIFVSVQNLFDRDPPIAPVFGPTGFLQPGTNSFLYDMIGRQYRAGVRFKF